jgi:SRSO17 transposase
MKSLSDNTIDPEGRVMIIDRRPPCLQAFFEPFRSRVSRPQFSHLWSLLLAWVANVRRSTVLNLAMRLPDGLHRTSHGRFLTQSDWDAAGLLIESVGRELRRMRPQRGEAIYLIIDDHRIAKRGRKMDGLSKIWDHKEQRFVYGHIVVTAAVLFRGVIFPWQFELWLPKSCAARTYRKTTRIAADLIAAFEPPAGLRVRVLFDAFYLCPTVTKACENRGFSWFSVASRNRWFTRTSGVDQKIADVGPGLLKYRGRAARMKRSRGTRRLRIVDVVGSLAKIGPVKLVFSKRPRDPWKNLVAFGTNETKLDARAIVSIYERRWRIEVLFKELEGDLGLGDYQVLTHRGIVHHLHVCGLVHLMLTHHGMDAVGAKARKANLEVALPSLSCRLETLRAAIKQDQLERIVRHEKNQRLRRRIETYLLAA